MNGITRAKLIIGLVVLIVLAPAVYAQGSASISAPALDGQQINWPSVPSLTGVTGLFALPTGYTTGGKGTIAVDLMHTADSSNGDTNTVATRVVVAPATGLEIGAAGFAQSDNDAYAEAVKWAPRALGTKDNGVRVAVGGAHVNLQQVGTGINQAYIVATGSVSRVISEDMFTRSISRQDNVLALTVGATYTRVQNSAASFDVSAWRAFGGAELCVGSCRVSYECQKRADAMDYADLTSLTVNCRLRGGVALEAGTSNAASGVLGDAKHHMFAGVSVGW